MSEAPRPPEGPSAFDQTVIRPEVPSTPSVPSGAATPDPAMQQRLGGYRLLKKLGSGGMGAIYLALQESVGRQVAIKVLPESAFHDPDAVARFQREIQVLGQLKHPGICPVLDSGLEGKTHFYVMDYIRGMDLGRVLGAQRVDPRRAATIAAQVAQALHSAHQAGVVHRDIKPLNIMLTRGEKPRDARGLKPDSTSFGGALKRFFSWATVAGRGAQAAPAAVVPTMAEGPEDAGMPSPEWRDRAVLIDFGLARDGAAATNLTVTGALMGTPSYMAPEQARGDRKAIGPATDVYGLGATLYEMLTLRPPFLGETMGEVIAKVTNEEPVPVRRLNPLVDVDLETIVQKAMEKEPSRRYAGAAAMAQDLDNWLAGEAIQARRASFAYRIRKRISRNKLASSAIAAAVAILLVGSWLAGAPGELEFTGADLEGARISVDGKACGARVGKFWPGAHKYRIEREGYVDTGEVDVQLPARSRVTVPVSLESRFGEVTIDSLPHGAEVKANGTTLGVTPLNRARIPTGDRVLELVLPDYETELVKVTIAPQQNFPAPLVTLRHKIGWLTLTSDPPELGIDLWADGAEDRITAAAPAKRYPLPTGRYRVVAHARNHHDREFRIEIRAGEELQRNVTLPTLFRWRTMVDYICESMAAGDLNGDGRPDLVVASKFPPRIRALDGRNGEVMWIVRKPSMTVSIGLPLSIVDVDGDLEPEVVYAAGDRFVELDGKTGLEKIAWDFPGLRNAVEWGDLDGDGLPDFTAQTSSLLVALRGVDGKRLWSIPTSTWPAVARGDANGDGVNDAFVGNALAGFTLLDGKTGRAIWTLAEQKDIPVAAAVDVDGDGLDDAVLSAQHFGNAAISGKDGRTLWKTPGDDIETTAAPVVADLDGDGKRELVICRQSFLDILDLATGKLVLSRPVNPTCRPAPCDLDGDGKAELIMGGSLGLMAYDPFKDEHLWTADVNLAGGGYTPFLDDFDGDGFQDVAVTGHDGAVAVLSADDPPLFWRQVGPHGHTAEPEILGSPPKFVFVAGAPHRLLDPLDGRILDQLTLVTCKLSIVYGAQEPYRIALDGQDRALLEVQTNPPKLSLVWHERDQPVLSQPTLFDVNGDGTLDLLTGDGEGGPGVRASDGKTGKLIWNAVLGRPWRADIAAWQGLLWVPADTAVHGLDPATGKEVRKFETGIAAEGALVWKDDLLVWNLAGRLWRFHPGPGGAMQEVWKRDLGISLAPRGVVCSEAFFTASGSRGTTVALDPDTGRERWRRVLEQPSGAGAGLCDLDGDGLPEVAVTGFENGWIWVLSGKTGEVLWSWCVGSIIGWARPVWADLDGDGFPELLDTSREGRVYAFKVNLKRPPLTSWLRPAVDAAQVRRASDAEWRRRAVLDARRHGRNDDILAAAETTADPFIAFEAVRAAGRLDDLPALARFAALARRAGVRRTEVELAACAAEAPEARSAALTKALLAAPLPQLWSLSPPAASLKADWQEALLAAAKASEDAGDWERAVALHSLRPDFAAASAACDRSAPGGTPSSRIRLARGRAAVAAGEYGVARDDFRALLSDSSVGAAANVELDALSRIGDQLVATVRGTFARSEFAAGAAAAERLVKLRPLDPDAWNEFAWAVANSPGVPHDLALRAVAAARRCLELVDATGAGPGLARAGFMDTLAAALFASGDVAEAIRVQREAIEICPPGVGRIELEARLKKYEDAARGQ